MVTKHQKPSANSPQGGISKMEAPIHVSNLMLVEGTGNPTRTGHKLNEKGQMMRFSKKTGDTI
jgi:large subunit ribosomal protein L24